MKSFDVIISGGGIAGLTLALDVLQHSELSVALIETNPASAQSNHGEFDTRVVALSKQSEQYLQSLGLALKSLAAPIKHIQVSDQGHIGLTQLSAAEMQVDALGFVTPLATLGQALYAMLKDADAKRLHWFSPDSIEKVQQHADAIQLRLHSGATLNGQLLVVAEGGQSSTKQQLNIHTNNHDYAVSALIANVASDQIQQNIAYERFTEQGPLALLPMQNYSRHSAQYSLVWTLKPPQAEQLMAASDGLFLSRLQQQVGFRAGHLIQVGQKQLFNLNLLQAERLFSHRAVLVANSAQSLHPIAGQGLNLGLRDIQQLCALLVEAAKQHRDIGSFGLLNTYTKRRDSDKRQVIRATDFLASGFANQYWPLVLGRNLGLLALQQFGLLRQRLATRAMGYHPETEL